MNNKIGTNHRDNKCDEYIDLYVQKNIDLCLNECFGTWIDKLWYRDRSSERPTTFEDEKEIFFRTFQFLLEKGHVIVLDDLVGGDNATFNFSKDGKNLKQILVNKSKNANFTKPVLESFPNDPIYNYWNADPKYIIDYVRSIFPKNVKDLNDEIMTIWFFSKCPRIGWVDQETGEVTAS